MTRYLPKMTQPSHDTQGSLAKPRTSAGVGAGAGGAALVFVATVIALGAGNDQERMLGFALAGAVVAFALVGRPQWIGLALVVTGATVFPSKATAFAVAGLRSDLVEVLGLAFLALALMAWLAGTRRPSSPFAGPVSLLLVAAVVGAIVGQRHGASLGEVQGPLRTYFLYGLCLPFAWFFATFVDRRRLADWIVGLGSLGSAAVVVHQAGVHILNYAVSDEVVTLGSRADVARIRAPVTTLAVLALLIVVARAAKGIGKLEVAEIAVLSTCLALSYTRSTWFATFVGIVLVVVARPGPRVPLRGLRTALVVLAAGTGLYAVATLGGLGHAGQVVASRFGTSLNSRVVEDQSYQQRLDENAVAVKAIRRNPVVGVGLARPFGVDRVVYVADPAPRLVTVPQLFVHNIVLMVWLQLGLLGVAALAWLVVRLLRTLATARVAGTELTVAGAAAAVAFLLQGLLQTTVQHRPTLIALGLALALATPVLAPAPTPEA
ncbi:MAG: O-Antigen ligase [Actinomycetota bacterium]|jgi:O-antigen ligase|nr:O-Antigen ligase [Actinomycetota bacterium]